MVTVSLELWHAGTMPGGQRRLHSSQDKPAGREASGGGPNDRLRNCSREGSSLHRPPTRGAFPLRGGIITASPQLPALVVTPRLLPVEGAKASDPDTPTVSESCGSSWGGCLVPTWVQLRLLGKLH